MSITSLALLVLVIGAAYFYLGQRTILGQRASGSVKVHSLPHYYGLWAGLIATIPALLLLVVLSVGDGLLFKQMVTQFYPPEVLEQDFASQAIVFTKIMNVVEGIHPSSANQDLARV